MAGPRQIFRYDLNKASIGLILFIGSLFFIAALLLWIFIGLGGLMTATFIGTLFIGVTFFSMASYWDHFRRTRFIAITDDSFFVGSDQKAWKVHWSLIDRESLNFDELQLSRLNGEIKINAAGQRVDVPLYTPFVFLNDLEGLIFEILQRLEGGAPPEIITDAKTRILHSTSSPADEVESVDDGENTTSSND